MEGIGWIAALIMGGFAGWIASKVMRADTGLFANILLGIIGAMLANWLPLAIDWAGGPRGERFLQ